MLCGLITFPIICPRQEIPLSKVSCRLNTPARRFMKSLEAFGSHDDSPCAIDILGLPGLTTVHESGDGSDGTRVFDGSHGTRTITAIPGVWGAMNSEPT